MSDAARTPPLFRRNFVTLLAAQATFGYAFSSFFMLPKFLVTELGASPVEIGLVAASYSTATSRRSASRWSAEGVAVP